MENVYRVNLNHQADQQFLENMCLDYLIVAVEIRFNAHLMVCSERGDGLKFFGGIMIDYKYWNYYFFHISYTSFLGPCLDVP